MNDVCIGLTRHKRLHNVYTQADVSWHAPIAHDSADWPHSRHALVTRQPVSMALHVALAQRRMAARRQAVAQGAASSSSSTQPAASSSTYYDAGGAAHAAMPEPLARQLPPPDPREWRVRPRGSVAAEVEIVE